MINLFTGFGSFNLVVGPWRDDQSSMQNAGVGVGTEINGGAKGATISAITIDAPFNLISNSANRTHWRCVVTRRTGPLGGLAALQQATLGWPNQAALQMNIEWAKMIASKTTADNYFAACTESHMHFPFPDNTGPSCGPGEVLSVYFFPIFNNSLGTNNMTLVSLSVHGSYSRGRRGTDARETLRSLPKGYRLATLEGN